MPARSTRPSRAGAALLAAATLAVPASAAPVADGWPTVAAAFDNERDCALAVTGNGRFYRIAASGYPPGTRARLAIANSDMKPIDRVVRIDGAGRHADFYLPFLWHRDGGTVSVSVSTPACSLAVAFAWRRAGPVTH